MYQLMYLKKPLFCQKKLIWNQESWPDNTPKLLIYCSRTHFPRRKKKRKARKRRRRADEIDE